MGAHLRGCILSAVCQSGVARPFEKSSNVITRTEGNSFWFSESNFLSFETKMSALDER